MVRRGRGPHRLGPVAPLLLGLGLGLVLSCAAQTGQAQTRWHLGIKAGSMLGIGGIALERGNGASAIGANVGIGEDRQVLVFIGRRYGSARAGNRAFVDARIGMMRVDSGVSARFINMMAVGAGYEAPTLGLLRLTVEAGLGAHDIQPSFTPLTQAGLFVGATVSVNF